MACILVRGTAAAGGSRAAACSAVQPLSRHVQQHQTSLLHSSINISIIDSGQKHSSVYQSGLTSPRSSSSSRCSPLGRRQLASTAAASAAQQVEREATADPPHVSVLLDEVLAAFGGRQVRCYVDGTLGAAGHAAAMLAQHPELQSLVGFDLDPTAHALASARLADAGARVVPVAVSATGAASFEAGAPAPGVGPTAFIVRSNFGRIARVLQQLPLGGASAGGGDGGHGGSGALDGGGVDAILLDLGISSMQVGRDGVQRWQGLAAPVNLGAWRVLQPRALKRPVHLPTRPPATLPAPKLAPTVALAPGAAPTPQPPCLPACRWTPLTAASPSSERAPWTCAWTRGQRCRRRS